MTGYVCGILLRSQLRKEIAGTLLAGKTAHDAAMVAASTEMEQLENNAVEAILLGASGTHQQHRTARHGTATAALVFRYVPWPLCFCGLPECNVL
jgi:hypothetical protein